MKTSLDHLPPVKQHELRRVVEVVLEGKPPFLTGLYIHAAILAYAKRFNVPVIFRDIQFGKPARRAIQASPSSEGAGSLHDGADVAACRP